MSGSTLCVGVGVGVGASRSRRIFLVAATGKGQCVVVSWNCRCCCCVVVVAAAVVIVVVVVRAECPTDRADTRIPELDLDASTICIRTKVLLLGGEARGLCIIIRLGCWHGA